MKIIKRQIARTPTLHGPGPWLAWAGVGLSVNVPQPPPDVVPLPPSPQPMPPQPALPPEITDPALPGQNQPVRDPTEAVAALMAAAPRAC